MTSDSLTNKQYRFLMLLYSGSVPRSKVAKRFPGYTQDLEFLDSAFQNCFYCSGDNFCISVSGKSLFEDRRRKNFRFRFPVIISILAIILSIISIALQYI